MDELRIQYTTTDIVQISNGLTNMALFEHRFSAIP